MIENIQRNQVSHIMGKGVTPNADAPNGRSSEGTDATLQVNFADLIGQAMQAKETDANVVEKARELLQSGELTSPESIRSAARNMVTFGI